MSTTKQNLATVLRQLGSAVRACKLYPEGHPSIHTPMLHLASALAVMLRERDRIVLGLIDDVLVLDEMPFYEANEEFSLIYNALLRWDVEAVLFYPGVTLSELERLARVLASQDEEQKLSIIEEAEKNSIPNIAFREKVIDEDDPRALLAITYEESLGEMVELMSQLRLGKIAFEQNATEMLNQMRDVILTSPAALFGLTLLKKYDHYTYSHSITTAMFALAYGKHLGLDEADLRRITLAGLLHDIGKVRTAERIIKKPGALTEEELEIMQKHPVLSEELLGELQDVDEDTRLIVLHHHIRFDGTGYPQLQKNEAPHPFGKVVAISDCYDALTSTRPYQKSRHPGDAVRIMRRLAGKAYEPEFVEEFVAMLGAYPVGDLVRLSSGELAVVATLNHVDATSPKLKIVQSANGTFLDSPIECDLASKEAGEKAIVSLAENCPPELDIMEILIG